MLTKDLKKQAARLIFGGGGYKTSHKQANHEPVVLKDDLSKQNVEEVKGVVLRPELQEAAALLIFARHVNPNTLVGMLTGYGRFSDKTKSPEPTKEVRDHIGIDDVGIKLEKGNHEASSWPGFGGVLDSFKGVFPIKRRRKAQREERKTPRKERYRGWSSPIEDTKGTGKMTQPTSKRMIAVPNPSGGGYGLPGRGPLKKKPTG